jgi:YHS domain-containing protein
MGTLLYFAIFAGLFFLMMRFGCGLHVMGHGHGAHEGHGSDASTDADRDRQRWVPPETDIDPVCRMSVQAGGAKSSVYRGTVYYFCSAEHRDQFEADPERYVGSRVAAAPQPMEHHHG